MTLTGMALRATLRFNPIKKNLGSDLNRSPGDRSNEALDPRGYTRYALNITGLALRAALLFNPKKPAAQPVYRDRI